MSSLITSPRGISTLIAAVIVMTFSMVLAVGLGYVLTHTINLSLGPTVTCAPLQITPPLTIEKAVYKASEGRVELTLNRPLEATTLTSFSIGVTDATGTARTWECGSFCGDCTLMGAGETKIYSFNEELLSPRVSLEVNGCPVTSRELEQA